MEKEKRLTVRASKDDIEKLSELSSMLQRNQSDTLRFILRRAYYSLKFPEGKEGSGENGDQPQIQA